VRDGGAYGCAVPRAYANLNPGLLVPISRIASGDQRRADVREAYIAHIGAFATMRYTIQIHLYLLVLVS